MKTKIILLIFIASVIIELIIMPFRGINLWNVSGVILSMLFGFTLYFFWTMFCLKKYLNRLNVSRILIPILIGFLIIQLPVRIYDFQGTLCSLPDCVCHFLGILFGYITYRKLQKWKWAFFITGIIICLLLFVWLIKENYFLNV